MTQGMTIHDWLKSQEFEVNRDKTAQPGEKMRQFRNEVEAKETWLNPRGRVDTDS